MSVLSERFLKKTYDTLSRQCSPLYPALFEALFLAGDATRIPGLLESYQNPDGGFGHGLEPDMLMPHSSVTATLQAFRILDLIAVYPQPMVLPALEYLKAVYDPLHRRWYAASKEVNDYPHAPWWQADRKTGLTVIDEQWGNPAAAVLALLYRFRELIGFDPLDELIDYAIERFEAMDIFPSVHEVYCLIELFDAVDSQRAQRLALPLERAYRQLVVTDESKWHTYVPRPLDFFWDQEHDLFHLVEPQLEKNVRYIRTSMGEDGIIGPSWDWGEDSASWQRARAEWTGWLSIRGHLLLRQFSHLEGDAHEQLHR